MQLEQSTKLQGVCYDVRGPVLREANRLQASGVDILKLNIGNPAPFGFAAPQGIVEAIRDNVATSHGYGDSQGLLAAREAVVASMHRNGVEGAHVDNVFIGNGSSELIAMALQALLNNGDEVLIPAPDYPLWTATTRLSGGTPVHYRCDETNGWQPDLADLESKITARTKALVVINPNNPTGAVYGREVLEQMVELARRHNLLLMSDEIYDRILFDDAQHIPTAALAPDLLCLTFNGLAKSYRVAGYRVGWMTMTGPVEHATSYLEGLSVLANMRLCPAGPGQHAIPVALGGDNGLSDLLLPQGRLRAQRDTAWNAVNSIPGVSCSPPMGALYLFPRLDPQHYRIENDETWVLDLLREQHILLVHGTAFNWPTTDHVRIVTLPETSVLSEAIGRWGEFLSARYVD